MDVRCERCRVQYVFGEDQVGPDGLTVRCSNCGHVFLVKKKALVVTVPVKPGELREAPVATADLDRGTPPQGSAGARPGAEKPRPWTLRNHRGDLYPFKDLSTLQKWIVERKTARDDEVSHLGGPWRRVGDMLELEPFFALVERAERAVAPAPIRAERSATPAAEEVRGPAVQPTLIDFPAPRPVFPGPGRQPAPAKTERFPVPPEANKPEPIPETPPSTAESTMSLGPSMVAAEDGPMLSGELAPVSGTEPAWTTQPHGRPPEQPTKSLREAPARAKRSRSGPVVVVLALAAAAAAVYVTKPGWLGLPASGVQQPPKADVQLPKVEPGQPGSPAQAEPAPTRAENAPVAPEAPVAGTPPARSSPSAEGSTATATPSTTPTASSNATPSSNSTSNSGATATRAASPASPADPGTPSNPTSTRPEPAAAPQSGGDEPAAATAKETPPPVDRPVKVPPKVAEVSPKRPSPAAQPVEKPGGIKRLLADARRLRVRGKPDAALRTYGHALDVEPRNVDALAGRGLCYLDLSQYGPAEASFQAALETDARHAEALMGLAETYRYEGRRTEAVTYYQKYVAAHPDGEDAAAARNAIDALKE